MTLPFRRWYVNVAHSHLTKQWSLSTCDGVMQNCLLEWPSKPKLPPSTPPKKKLQMMLGWVFKDTVYRVDTRCRILSINRMDGHPIIGQSAFFIGTVCVSFLPLVRTQNSWYKNPHILSCLILALLSTTGKTSWKYTEYCCFLQQLMQMGWWILGF